MRAIVNLLLAFGIVASRAAQTHVFYISQDGWRISADLYGAGARGVVLVHGGRFTKESWEPQARELVKAGFRVLAIDLRGFGDSKAGPPDQLRDGQNPLDVLAAVRYLRGAGATNISVVGGSMGGDAAADASVLCQPGEIDRVVMIANGGVENPGKMKGRKLFITCRGDLGPGDKPRLDNIWDQFLRTPKPKRLALLDGSAHAQFIFKTAQGAELMREILDFLTAP
jgi:pimeloyl-ACP methyl ester carboxylesterase